MQTISDVPTINWDKDIQPEIQQLLDARPVSAQEKKEWLMKKNHLWEKLSEEGGWRYIRMTCNTQSEFHKNQYLDFIRNIEPRMTEAEAELKKKYISFPEPEECLLEGSSVFVQLMKKSVELFRKENIPLQTELQELSQQFSEISGNQSAAWEGKTLPLQAISVYLKNIRRDVRKKAWEIIQIRKKEDEDALNRLLTRMIELRNKVALNSGYKNYRDYRHEELGRLDYNVGDVLRFHQSVEEAVVPLMRKAEEKRVAKMGLTKDYRPWDTQAPEDSKELPVPFSSPEDLLEKTIRCFKNLDPYFAEVMIILKKENRLDLGSRIGKAPGGYQYPLYQSRIPFIFMNAAGTLRDVTTLIHEGGHAVHTFLSNSLPLIEQISVPSEMAELASMSTELLTMDYWDIFYPDEDDLKKAQKEFLRDILTTLPWIATIDAFQHFLYLHPHHSVQERYQYWTDLHKRFGNTLTDYSGLEHYRNIRWQSQLHIFEVPFYYIEYGIAQLGAIALRKNYEKNKKKTLDQFKEALSYGYTKPLPELYRIAGIRFDFSKSYIEDLMGFLYEKYDALD